MLAQRRYVGANMENNDLINPFGEISLKVTQSVIQTCRTTTSSRSATDDLCKAAGNNQTVGSITNPCQ